MFKVQFRNTTTGQMLTFTLDEGQARAAVAFARTLGEDAATELRVRTPEADRFGPVWADVTHQF